MVCEQKVEVRLTPKDLAEIMWGTFWILICDRELESSENFDGLCGLASWYLAMVLRQHGYDACVVSGTMYGHYHCWVKSDGYYYDITCSQFFVHNSKYEEKRICKIGSRKSRDYAEKQEVESISYFRCFDPEDLRPCRQMNKMILTQFKKCKKRYIDDPPPFKG